MRNCIENALLWELSPRNLSLGSENIYLLFLPNWELIKRWIFNVNSNTNKSKKVLKLNETDQVRNGKCRQKDFFQTSSV